jgi:hypothetical protein
MKKLIFLLSLILVTGSIFAQTQQLKKNFELLKYQPTLYLTGTYPAIVFNRSGSSGNARLVDSASYLQIKGAVNFSVLPRVAGVALSALYTSGDIALGANNITMTGSIASTGSRVTKGWFTDISSTNIPTVGGVAITTNTALTTPTVVTSIVGGTTFAAFNTVTTTLTFGGAATTMTIGGTPSTAVTHNYSTNPTATGTTKTVNIATGAVSGSTTNINLGSAYGGTVTTTSPYLAIGSSTLSTGFTLNTASTHIWTAGGSVVLATSGTDVACANGTRFWSEIMIPRNTTITGISYLVGSVGGTDSVQVYLYNSAGTAVATSKHTGATHGSIVGTAAQFQSLAFNVGATPSPYAAVAGLYYVCVQFNGTTAKFRAYPIPGSPFIAGSVAGTWDVSASITPGTTFTADKGPICITY